MSNTPFAFGEENPTAGETAVSWQTWINSSGTVPTILGDADWGSLSLPLSGGEGRSAVYFVTGTSTVFSLAKNVYGTGGTEAILEIRGSTGSFSQSSASPTWEIYTGSITRSWQYVQVRARTGNIYYIDATGGSDSNSGTYSQPWQTIAKVEASTFQPGDRILFKRGETWRGEKLVVPSSGASGSPITFGAYGTGNNPLFDPTTELNDFSSYSGNIWRRSQLSADNVRQVFEDDERMIFAANIAAMVQGSWAYDSSTPGYIYVWCSDDGNPNTGHVIEYDTTAVTLGMIQLNGQSYIDIDGIDFNRDSVAVICADTGTTHVNIRNCTAGFSAGRSFLIGTDGGVTYTYPEDVTISNCVGHDDLDVPFWIGHCTRVIVEDCEAYNSGADVDPNGKLYPDTTHFPDGILVSAEATDCIIRGNYVHDCYNLPAIIDELSLGDKGSDTIIEGNLIDQTGMTNDCLSIAGIRTVVRNNIIYSGSGYGIILANTPTTPLIYHNTIISPDGAGHSINCVLNPGATVKNNIIIRAGSTNRYLNVPAAAQTGFEADNNLYYGSSTGRWFWGPTEYTTFANWKSNSSQDANGFNEDPVVVTQWTNLHLQSGSPCRNAGEDLNVATDYDGVARDDTPDIGAYEYVA